MRFQMLLLTGVVMGLFGLTTPSTIFPSFSRRRNRTP